MSKIPNLPANKNVTQGKGTALFSFLASLWTFLGCFFHKFLDLKDFSQGTKMPTGCLKCRSFRFSAFSRQSV